MENIPQAAPVNPDRGWENCGARRACGLCSVKQAKLLAARDLAPEPYELSKDEASELIERFLESVGAR